MVEKDVRAFLQSAVVNMDLEDVESVRPLTRKEIKENNGVNGLFLGLGGSGDYIISITKKEE